MRYEKPEIIDPDADEWGHRRANMRHDVAVPAVLTDMLGIEVDCMIEDVSSTGMLLAIQVVPSEPSREPLKQGTLATLVFAPDPQRAPNDKVSTSVRIMWRAPIAVGIAFAEPTPALRAGLRVIAQNAVNERIASGRTTGPTAEQRAILKACRQTLQKLLPNIIWSMRTELVNRLRTLADESKGAEAAEAAAEADLIESKAMGITRTIEHEFLQGFAAVSDLEQTQEMTLMQLKATSKAKDAASGDGKVVATRVAEHNARIVALAQRVEERYKSQFFELSVRLANVLGHQLDDRANPLVPGGACRIFWEAVTSYSDSGRVQKQLHQAMLARVMPLLGELYDGINKTLDEQGAKRIFDVRRDLQRKVDP